MAMMSTSQSPKVTTITAGSPSSLGPYYLDMRRFRHWDMIATWTGTIAGTWKIEDGAGYAPSPLEAKAGSFTDVTATSTPAITNPTGAAGSTEESAIFCTSDWARVSLNTITGSGDVTICLRQNT